MIIALVLCISVGQLLCHDKQRNSIEYCSMSTVAEHHARPGDCSGLSREGKEGFIESRRQSKRMAECLRFMGSKLTF